MDGVYLEELSHQEPMCLNKDYVRAGKNETVKGGESRGIRDRPKLALYGECWGFSRIMVVGTISNLVFARVSLAYLGHCIVSPIFNGGDRTFRIYVSPC